MNEDFHASPGHFGLRLFRNKLCILQNRPPGVNKGQNPYYSGIRAMRLIAGLAGMLEHKPDVPYEIERFGTFNVNCRTRGPGFHAWHL